MPCLSPAAAATGAAELPLPDRVTCVFDAMTSEEREIALLLVVEELVAVDSNNRKRAPSTGVREVERLLEVAHSRCLARWPWTAGKSRNAISWANAAIYREANAQAVSNLGKDPAAIDGFVAEHLREMERTPNAATLWLPALRKHLAELGWGDRNEPAVSFAVLYFEQVIAQQDTARDFVRGMSGSSRN